METALKAEFLKDLVVLIFVKSERRPCAVKGSVARQFTVEKSGRLGVG
jgi:hypothetical protein